MDTIKHLIRHGFVRKIEKDGIVFETGPNAILLSDITVQNGRFWNLAEFPFLHMLYRQGLAIPGHPGNTGRRPIIAGMSGRCDAVISYILRGTYGLTSPQEMEESGIYPQNIDEQWKLKLKFAGGKVKSPENLIDVVRIGEDAAAIAGDVSLTRIADNVYRFEYGGESVEVDMNLAAGADWSASYSLPSMDIAEGYFSITHIGEGNGWDPDRPCMGSIVTFRGRRYLIDAGPGIDYSLEALGIDVSEIDGLFFTHVHDDHFAGLTSLIRGDRRMRVYATRPVMSTVRGKCEALLEAEKGFIDEMIDVRYLEEGEWNDIDGLEVRPAYSPHPLETTILFFRSLWEGGYRSYAHLADITSYSVLESFIGDDGISRDFFDKVKAVYSRAADVKKIDVGRGMIHGASEDFADDPSPRIVLSHTEGGLSDADREIGAEVDFGHVDILIPDRGNRLREIASMLMAGSIPGLTGDDYDLLLNGKVQRFDPGTILLRKGSRPDDLLLIISGTVDRKGPDGTRFLRHAAGSIIGETEFLNGRPAAGTCYCRGHVKAMRLPADLFVHALSKAGLLEERTEVMNRCDLLTGGPFPGGLVVSPRLNRLAAAARNVEWTRGSVIDSGSDELYVLRSGKIVRDGAVLNSAGSWFNASAVLPYAGGNDAGNWHVEKKTRGVAIPGETVRSIPVLAWTLAEELRIP